MHCEYATACSQAREREEKIARGEKVRAVKYEWRVPDEPLSQMGALLMAGSVADSDTGSDD